MRIELPLSSDRSEEATFIEVRTDNPISRATWEYVAAIVVASAMVLEDDEEAK